MQVGHGKRWAGPHKERATIDHDATAQRRNGATRDRVAAAGTLLNGSARNGESLLNVLVKRTTECDIT